MNGLVARPRFDVMFLSIDEPLADELFQRLQRVLGPAKRLHGVAGMRRAYRLCAQVADTDQFFLADGDFSIDPDFRPAMEGPLPDGVAMRVWKARNPINGLVYGYGGLKLVRTEALANLGHAVDVLAALPGRVEFSPHLAGTTRIDQSGYHAFKAAFREVAMLAHGCEYGGTSAAQRDRRIAAWTTAGTGSCAGWAAAGARSGLDFAAVTPAGDADWEQINDPAWLRARFNAVAAR